MKAFVLKYRAVSPPVCTSGRARCDFRAHTEHAMIFQSFDNQLYTFCDRARCVA